MSRKVENVTRGFGSFHSSNFNDQIKNSEVTLNVHKIR